MRKVTTKAQQGVVRLLIELQLRSGHVELEVDGRFHGFWWDPNKKCLVKVPEDRMKRLESRGGAFGGWRGDYKDLSQAELAFSYNGMYVDRKRMYKAPPEFTVYEFPVSQRQKRLILDFLRGMHALPPEYNALSRGLSRNCVTISLDALVQADILRQDVFRLLTVPSPRHLEEIMLQYIQEHPKIRRYHLYLQCAQFLRQKPI